MRHVMAILAATTSLVPAAAQQPLVAPDGYATTEGNTNNFWPWLLYAPAPDIRVQQIYDSTHFTNQGVVGPITISRLRYRADGGANSWAGGTWPSVQIDMSTAAVDHLAASLTFAANHGPDLTTVLTGTVTVLQGSGGTPGPWYVDIALTTPFLYDPSSGNDLVVDLRISGAMTGSSNAVDYVSAAGSPPPRGTRVMSNISSSATTAAFRDLNYTPVTEFTFLAFASYGTFAPGCAGSAGVPSNQALALPVLGQLMIATIGNLPPPEVLFFVFGFSNTASQLGPLPLDLTPLGAPGCALRVSNDVTVLILGSAGSASFALAVPSVNSLIGMQFYTQALVLDATANGLGATTSDAAAGVFGL